MTANTYKRAAAFLLFAAASIRHDWVRAEESTTTAAQIGAISPELFPRERREQLASMLYEQQRRRMHEANDRSREAWNAIESREDWETLRDAHLDALRRSLGAFPKPPSSLDVRTTGQVAGEGFRIENIVFQSRPGLWVTANFYLPEPPREKSPGILICHSHHQPKEHGELQDMGMTWARAGCIVLIMDQLGHGERRQHPFRSAADYSGEFRVSRQDYYFRYDSSLQLYLAGESLVGWMARDLMRGVDLLLSRPNADPERIILLGAVAGGGDPAAVTGALDPRIAAVVPFNFGGPQPETRYPLPEDAETSFNYAGGGSWESTRNLRNSAAEGFLPWVIVGGVAPQRLVYAHEFRWDREHDPVWRRLKRIYELYGEPERLAFTHGRGSLQGQPPEATHCTHIGQPHRVLIHAAFQRWFDIAVTSDDEYSHRIEPERLRCMTEDAQAELRPRKLHELLSGMVAERAHAAKPRANVQETWKRLLGGEQPVAEPQVAFTAEGQSLPSGVHVERLALETAPGITVPLLLLTPRRSGDALSPVVVAVAQAGKEGFVRQRPREIASLLSRGIAVCLPDLRGTGESRASDDRARQSEATDLSATELMLGGTMLGAQVGDLRAVVQYIRGRSDIHANRIALWGDSFAEPNATETNFEIPHGVDGRPHQSEPMGGLAALLTALYDDDIAAVYVHQGLLSYEAVLASPLVYVPHDAVVPGALAAGDLAGVAAALAPRPLCLCGLVDQFNRRAANDQIQTAYAAATHAYEHAGHKARLLATAESIDPSEWLSQQIQQ